MWPLLGAIVRARRLLEVGCGLGYTAALMAEAGGPSSCVDTIEQVHEHADIAEKELRKRGLAERVRVLRGEASALLAMLSEPYDLVFVDGDWKDYPALLPDLKRLTHRGGILLTSNLFPLFEESASGLPDRDKIEEYLIRLSGDTTFRTFIFSGVRNEWNALSYRLP